ncbi:alanine racemase [Candidatus Gracilibacteria bacterium]|jgi:alanine racemase|nr:alanine racemase [Candidatus Gracilibacteria bacterium]
MHAIDVPSWIEIDHRALHHNVQFLRSQLSPRTKLFVVVKSNAYGHGIEAISQSIESLVDGVAVNTIAEGLSLRDLGFQKRIVVVGAYKTADLIVAAQERGLELEIVNETDISLLQHLTSTAAPLHIHIKLNTGLNRLGVEHTELHSYIERLKHTANVTIQGIFSHLASAENPDSLKTKMQLALFSEATATLPYERHIAACAATLLIPDSHYEIVRLGISSYGLWPSPETKQQWCIQHPQAGDPLQPVLSFHTRILSLRSLEAGESIGYDNTYTTSEKRITAVIPVGYYEGLPRGLSNKTKVVIGGQLVPVIGRIAMNMTVCDVSSVPNVVVGDLVTIIGQQGDAVISADDHAEHNQTINYEIVTRLPAFLPRRHQGLNQQ